MGSLMAYLREYRDVDADSRAGWTLVDNSLNQLYLVSGAAVCLRASGVISHVLTIDASHLHAKVPRADAVDWVTGCGTSVSSFARCRPVLLVTFSSEPSAFHSQSPGRPSLMSRGQRFASDASAAPRSAGVRAHLQPRRCVGVGVSVGGSVGQRVC